MDTGEAEVEMDEGSCMCVRACVCVFAALHENLETNQAVLTASRRNVMVGTGAPAEDPTDEPANSILFVGNLPEGTTPDMLQTLFKQIKGIKEVRQVGGRPDIAFIEYVETLCFISFSVCLSLPLSLPPFPTPFFGLPCISQACTPHKLHRGLNYRLIHVWLVGTRQKSRQPRQSTRCTGSRLRQRTQ
jgi:hypothetical protein